MVLAAAQGERLADHLVGAIFPQVEQADRHVLNIGVGPALLENFHGVVIVGHGNQPNAGNIFNEKHLTG